jgi:hypothetical protein
MANREQISSHIRFQLEQLSARNAHHDFEHLCRHLARARICSNIIPATGPVSTGGDQGRDFETFRTYLRKNSIVNSTFIGLISENPVAFACSLQKEIIGKIKSDVDTIMASDTEIEMICYFCISDMAVSKRHELQSWVEEKYSIDLQIFDGQAISELLSESDVFWIAEKYLNVPSEIFPRKSDKSGWYQETVEKWKERDYLDCTYAGFFELKTAARHALFSDDARPDLLFWIGFLEKFMDNNVPKQLRRKVIYEVAYLSLRGLGTLENQEDRLREYLDSIPQLEDPVDLRDATTVLNLCIGAVGLNVVTLSIDELRTWRDKLLSKVEENLKAAVAPSLRCPLLETRGYLSIYADSRQSTLPDPQEAIKWWTELTLVVKGAPLFPLEGFADNLSKFITLFDMGPDYDHLTQQVDKLLSERYGEFIAAEKCRDRALKFYEKGEILRAINQLHQAKVKWFAEETLRGSLLSMLMISRWYLELGVCFAAKYYALAAAFITLHSSKSNIKYLLPKALIMAAECDYHQGSWTGFLELIDIGLRAHGLFSEHTADINRDEDLQRTLFHTTMLMAITERIDSQLYESVATMIKEWQTDEWLKELLPLAQEAWEGEEISEIWTRLEEQLAGRPFGDLGNIREATWSELGSTWSVTWKNDYDTNPAVEQFIAVLQILLADIAHVDLCLLSTDITINVCAENIKDAELEPIPSNKGRKWNVTLPLYSRNENSDIEHLQLNTLTVASIILKEISLLPEDSFNKILENSFREGISMKAFVGQLYEILYHEFISQEVFENSNRSSKCVPEPNRLFTIKEHEELGWLDGPGPGYTKKKAHELLQNRYSQAKKVIKYTLKRLLRNSGFRATVERLRADEWLDWHILSSIATTAINYRVMQIPEAYFSVEMSQELFLEYINRPERETWTPVPISEFTEEKFRMYHRMNMLSTLKLLGLECRQATPDLEAIDHFLRVRYNYWTDDIEHTDPFI